MQESTPLNCSKTSIINSHCSDFTKILVIEDSTILQEYIHKDILSSLGISCDVASTEKDAQEMIAQTQYDLIIVDLYLPDSSGNFVAYLVRKKYRIIIITASEDKEQREKLVSLPIVDYIYKTDEKSITSYLTKSIKRLQNNKNILIAICDDSQLSRLQLKQLISTQNLPYIEFHNGEEAYHCIENKNLKINFLITDVNMPKMNGFDLIRKTRLIYDPYEVPILAFSSSENMSVIAQLLKTGANDYIRKPIHNEEFLTRLNMNLETSALHKENQLLIDNLQKLATTDFLTSLYNRTYFYNTINLVQSQAKRHKYTYGIAMVDIDYFKKVNDTYGHEAGDMALVILSKIIKETIRESDIPCRWGGEEFLILVPNTNAQELHSFAQRLCQRVQESVVSSEVLKFSITISIGTAISNSINLENVENVISMADERLYKAKHNGRNCVVSR